MVARIHSHAEYLEKLKSAGITATVPVQAYERDKVKILHRCKACGHQWPVSPNSVLRGSGCPLCAKIRFTEKNSLTAEEYQSRLDVARPGAKLIGAYKGYFTKTQHVCACGQNWMTTPSNALLTGSSRCQACYLRDNQVSKVGDAWLAQVEKILRIKVDREFRCGVGRYVCDGYNKRHNVVFEFLGDYWHGNPKTRKDERRAHKYERLKNKMKLLRAAGFTVVWVWESEFRKGHIGNLMGAADLAVRANLSLRSRFT